MTLPTLEIEIKTATEQLLQLARGLSWNKISSNCSYFLSEIKEEGLENVSELRKRERQLMPTPLKLEQAIVALKAIYPKLYDVNLIIYKATKTETIIEIKYFLKASLGRERFEKVRDDEPMLHLKVPLPPYADDKKNKIDINWKLGGFRHRWRMFRHCLSTAGFRIFSKKIIKL